MHINTAPCGTHNCRQTFIYAAGLFLVPGYEIYVAGLKRADITWTSGPGLVAGQHCNKSAVVTIRPAQELQTLLILALLILPGINFYPTTTSIKIINVLVVWSCAEISVLKVHKKKVRVHNVRNT